MKVKMVHKSQERAKARYVVYTFYINNTKFSFFLLHLFCISLTILKTFCLMSFLADFSINILDASLTIQPFSH